MEKMQEKALHHFLKSQLELSPFAWWEWDLIQNKVRFNGLKATMIGYDAAEFQNVGYQAFTDLLHPQDYEKTMTAMRRYLMGEVPLYQIDYRIRCKDGSYAWYMDRGIALSKDLDGKPTLLRGVVIHLEENPDLMDHTVITKLIIEILPTAEKSDRIISLCCVCHLARNEQNEWIPVGTLVLEAFPFSVSHVLCPKCGRDLFGADFSG